MMESKLPNPYSKVKLIRDLLFNSTIACTTKDINWTKSSCMSGSIAARTSRFQSNIKFYRQVLICKRQGCLLRLWHKSRTMISGNAVQLFHTRILMSTLMEVFRNCFRYPFSRTLSGTELRPEPWTQSSTRKTGNRECSNFTQETSTKWSPQCPAHTSPVNKSQEPAKD